MLAHVGREGDAGGLEDPADLAGDGGSGGDALVAVAAQVLARHGSAGDLVGQGVGRILPALPRLPFRGMLAPLIAKLAMVAFRSDARPPMTVDGLRASKGAWGPIGLAPYPMEPTAPIPASPSLPILTCCLTERRSPRILPI